MRLKKVIPTFLLLSTVVVGLWLTLTQASADVADTMIDISGKKVLAGYWHNWASKRRDGYKQETSASLNLSEVNRAYNVVPVSFMKSDGTTWIPTFKPYNQTDTAFRQEVAQLNSRGRAVLSALGGADAHIQLVKSDEQAFANEIIRQVETYGFDDLDIDLEQLAVTAGGNQTVIPVMLEVVKDHCRVRRKDSIITMAPEFPYLKPGTAYETYTTSLNGYYDYIAPQLHDQGGDGVRIDEITTWVAQSNDALKYEFLYCMSSSLVHDTRGYLQIPDDKLALGLPVNRNATGNGYAVEATLVAKTLDRLAKDGNPTRGLAAWSANWDVGQNVNSKSYNNEFAICYSSLVK